jgi:hypothetical protein
MQDHGMTHPDAEDGAEPDPEDWRQDLTELMNEFVTKDFEADHIDGTGSPAA